MGRESPYNLWFSLGRMFSSQSDCIKIQCVNRKSEMTPSEDSLLQFPREGDASLHEGSEGEVRVCQEMGGGVQERGEVGRSLYCGFLGRSGRVRMSSLGLACVNNVSVHWGWGLPLVIWPLALHWESDLEYKTSIEEVVVSGLVNLHTQGGRWGREEEASMSSRCPVYACRAGVKYQGYRSCG